MIFLLIPITILIFMVVEALSVAIAGSVFLDVPFGDAWHLAWDRPGWLLVFALVSIIFNGAGR